MSGQGVVLYDTETYPNYFLLGVLDLYSDTQLFFELSDRVDQSEAMLNFLAEVERQDVLMIGFNSLNFDYPILHEMRKGSAFATYRGAYDKASSIINSGDRWGHQIWASDRFARQLDLYRMNHFDNIAKVTSLKELQFTMRMRTVEDLPYPPGVPLTDKEKDVTTHYCGHDLQGTKEFAIRCWPDIAFRFSLVDRFGPEVLNWSDVKIGGEFLIKDLGWDTCYKRNSAGKREPRQTERYDIPVRDIVLPYIKFRSHECRALLNYMSAQTIVDTKASVKASVTLDGFQFDLGTGGIHGSQRGKIFRATDRRVIVDADVTSLYPSIAIENHLAPEHLGQKFVEKYSALKTERIKHPKKSPTNRALKLALNGTYGNSNNPWSPFYDPKFTMAITINGQLLLLMLAEELMSVPSLDVIQINTDGITYAVDECYEEYTINICTEWQKLTKLQLEFASYQSFFCRDVNNYIAVDVDGKVKRKGAYEFPEKPEDYLGVWHKDWSALVIQKSVNAHLVHGQDLAEFIRNCTDPFDFMLRFKCPRTSNLMLDGPEGPMQQQRITRYYATTDGGLLYKDSPPAPGCDPGEFKRKPGISDQEFWTVRQEVGPRVWDERIHTKAKTVYEDRTLKVHPRAGICNNCEHFSFDNLDHDWYISEARKLVDCLSV